MTLELRGGHLAWGDDTVEPTRHAPASPMAFVPAGCTLPVVAGQVDRARYLMLTFHPSELDAAGPAALDIRLLREPVSGFFAERLSRLARLFEWEAASESEAEPTLLRCVLEAFYAALARCTPSMTSHCIRGGLKPLQVRRVKDYIEDRLAETVSFDELASLTHLSRSHFCRAFKASVGMPAFRWQLTRRIRRAQELLLAGTERLAEVALATGFADQAHFTRTFRSLTGASPGVWRRLRAA